MTAIKKQANLIAELKGMIEKEGKAQTNISGKPGVDTKVTSISDSTETTDQNGVGPDKLNDEQGYEQKPSSDSSEPVAKTAEELGKDVLDAIAKLAKAQTDISGKPGVDTKVTSISSSTETTDQNGVGPDKINGEQGYEQKPSSDSSEPVAKAASYADTGKAFAEAILKRAAEVQELQRKQAEAEMLKEAGRRDWETVISHAIYNLEQQQKQAELADKQAELEGAVAFELLQKQAKNDALVSENAALKEKLASFEKQANELKEKQAAEKEEQNFQKIAAQVASIIEAKLKQ